MLQRVSQLFNWALTFSRAISAPEKLRVTPLIGIDAGKEFGALAFP